MTRKKTDEARITASNVVREQGAEAPVDPAFYEQVLTNRDTSAVSPFFTGRTHPIVAHDNSRALALTMGKKEKTDEG